MHQLIINITGLNAIVQSALLSAFFFTSKNGSRLGNRLFALFLLSFGLLIFSTMPGASFEFSHYYKIAFLARRVALLIPPLFLFYVHSCIDSKFTWQPRYIWHFLPFILLLSLSAYEGFAHGIWYLPRSKEYYWHTSLLVLQNFIYIMLMLRLFKKHHLRWQDVFFKADATQHKWVRFIILGYSIFWIFNFHNLFLFKVLKISSWCPYASSINCLIPFIFFNLIALLALAKPEIFSARMRKNSQPLDAQACEFYRRKLLLVMESRQPYLNPDLSLRDLAAELHLSSKQLSYVLNNALQANFYDFINQYRINASMQLLQKSETGKMNMLEIAYAVGFNSKSTFNLAFKKLLGLTPSEYKNQLPAHIKKVG